ncbi:hypothetical protein [Salinithrix halophila]|uniref:Uncharacterized protein n=1 Tax=Salinithrix halophila TaxID=1485204 RepID=A0ABV8JFV3_9BACL
MNIRFNTPHQYVFVHENVKHLLLVWPKEAKRQLFVVEEEDGLLSLTYPGETYEETVLIQVEPVFFRHLETDSGLLSVVLGATFRHQGRLMGMFYNREETTGPPFFFELREDDLQDIPEDEYEEVARVFLEEFPEYVEEM